MAQILLNGERISHAAYELDPQSDSIQKTLAKAKRLEIDVWCNCTTLNRRLVMRNIKGTLYLAAWPGDARNHKQSCRFHSDEAGSAAGPAAPEAVRTPVSLTAPPRYDPRLAAPEAVRTPVSLTAPPRYDPRLTLAFTCEGPAILPSLLAYDGKPAHGLDYGRERGSTAGEMQASSQGLTLLELLRLVWARARLNSWGKGWTRDYWRVWRETTSVLSQESMQDGRFLADIIYVPPLFRRETAPQVKTQWTTFAQGIDVQSVHLARRRLILGEIKMIDRGPAGFVVMLRNFAAPLYLPRALHTHIYREFSRPLTSLGTQSLQTVRVMGLFMVEVELKRQHLFVVDAALMQCTSAWLPVSSTFEAVLIDHLVADGRTFERLLPSGHDSDQEANLVLRDTKRPTALEVLTLDTTSYLEKKFAKIAGLRQRGFDIWTWRTANSGAMPPVPLPHLPELATNDE